MKTRAQLIKEIMADFEKDGEPVTEEEAGEIADLEIKAKKNNVKHYERSTKPRDKPTRERKIDTEKLEILEELQAALELCGITATREREVALHFGDYELKLIRHKKKQLTNNKKFDIIIIESEGRKKNEKSTEKKIKKIVDKIKKI